MVRMTLAAALLALAACASEPDWRKAEGAVSEQNPPSALSQTWISPLTPFEEIRDLNDKMRGEGWMIHKVEKAGPEFPGMYIVSYRR